MASHRQFGCEQASPPRPRLHLPLGAAGSKRVSSRMRGSSLFCTAVHATEKKKNPCETPDLPFGFMACGGAPKCEPADSAYTLVGGSSAAMRRTQWKQSREQQPKQQKHQRRHQQPQRFPHGGNNNNRAAAAALLFWACGSGRRSFVAGDRPGVTCVRPLRPRRQDLQRQSLMICEHGRGRRLRQIHGMDSC